MNIDQLNHYKQKLAFEVRELMGGLDWWKRDGYATAGEGAQVGTGISCGC